MGNAQTPAPSPKRSTRRSQPWSPIDVAALYLGRKEVIGPESDPAILHMLQLDASWPQDDATPWCAAFVNYCAYMAGFVRSKSLRARSYLEVPGRVWTRGQTETPEEDARAGDVLVFRRGRGAQPGPDVVEAPGHVSFYTGRCEGTPRYRAVWVLGGNQGDAVSIRPYSLASLLAVVRLRPDPSLGFFIAD